MRLQPLALSGLALLAQGVSSHPGHDLTTEIAERRDFLLNTRQSSLNHCRDKLAAAGVDKRNVARRVAQVTHARQKRGLIPAPLKRDADEVLSEDHNQTDLGYTPNTDADTLFSGMNSCVLTPEVTQGPYYVGGEDIRRDVREGQDGLDIVLDYQVIDVDTCEPVQDVFVEIWHCNSTGVYSGVSASGNGDTSDSSNIDNTFLRGIQRTDEDGVAQFESLFPGHYRGRATHIHIMVHTNATVYSNETLGNDVYASHIGQSFFDQDLISKVETLSPYNTNAQDLTLNSEDSILANEAEDVDPLMEYTFLGDSISDGLFAWIAFGINTTYSDAIEPAVFRYEDGGVTNPDGGSGGPGNGGPGNGGGPGGNGNGLADVTSDDAAATESSSGSSCQM